MVRLDPGDIAMNDRRRALHVGGGALIVAVAVAVGAWVVTAGGDDGSAAAPPSPSPSPSPSLTPEPAALPDSVPIHAELDGWDAAPTTVIARVTPQVGDAADGTVSAYVEAPVVDTPTVALSTEVTLAAGVVYEFSAQVRSASARTETVSASFDIAGTRVALPELDANWAEVSATVEVPADADSTAVRLVVDAPVDSLSVDAVSLSEAGGENLVSNPSFESAPGRGVIVNRSLILSVDRPALAVRGAGDTAWRAEDLAGNPIATGSATLAGEVDILPLTGLGAGYYRVTVADANGAETAALLGVVDFDGQTIPADQRFGVGLHVEGDLYNDSADLAASLGIGLARNDILWRWNETTRGRYDWADHYSENFDRLHARGIHLLGIVNYGNKLYGSGKAPETPEAIAAYGRYAAAIAERFDLIGLEVFNEFNQERFNDTLCGTDPACYVPLLRAVHDEVGAVDPDLPIVAGSTARYDADWFDGLWQAGGLEYADVTSFHPYEVSGDPDSLAEIMTEANRSMRENGGDTRPIWITELGTSSKTGGKTLSQQADYLVRTSVTALASGAERFFWYDLINDDPDRTVHEGNFGMYFQRRTGVPALQPKPVGYAQAVMVSQLAGRDFTRTEVLGTSVIRHRFGGDESALSVMWSQGDPAVVEVSSDDPVTVVDMNGMTETIDPVDGRVEISVDSRPLFVATTERE